MEEKDPWHDKLSARLQSRMTISVLEAIDTVGLLMAKVTLADLVRLKSVMLTLGWKLEKKGPMVEFRKGLSA